eukprot:TRINITY_DN891_c0_g1_i2.p1 TRINITY_DN891_c0_g1~~TRINITY_DN891_c0_g1_i2.p1  ORF type:complete len:262 (+),score=50.58 TRINITY_DN891_c0_g1_i2:196-981(+)
MTNDNVDSLRELERILLAGKDYYLVLQVHRTCDLDLIKKQYKNKALLVHPDKNSDLRAEECFKLLAEAFTCLSDAELRKHYDAGGEIDEATRRKAEVCKDKRNRMENRNRSPTFQEFSMEMKVRLAAELYRQVNAFLCSLNSSLASSVSYSQPSHPQFASVTGYNKSQPPAFGSVTGYSTSSKPQDFGTVTGYASTAGSVEASSTPKFGSVTGYSSARSQGFGSVTGYSSARSQAPNFGSVTNYQKQSPPEFGSVTGYNKK